jgi:hypothetical protein
VDREVALGILTDRVAAASRPVLSDATLNRILDQWATPDTEGRPASDAAWVPSFDLNAAAAEGWRLKAGMVAGDFNFSADGASYSKADVLAHCLEMEAKYASRSHGVLATLAGRPTLPPEWDGNQVP